MSLRMTKTFWIISRAELVSAEPNPKYALMVSDLSDCHLHKKKQARPGLEELKIVS